MSDLLLLPQPRRVERRSAAHTLQSDRLIWLASAAPQLLRFAALRFQQVLRARTGLAWPIVAGMTTASDQVGLALHLAPDRITQPQGYELAIELERVTIAALLRREFELAVRIMRTRPGAVRPACHRRAGSFGG